MDAKVIKVRSDMVSPAWLVESLFAEVEELNTRIVTLEFQLALAQSAE